MNFKTGITSICMLAALVGSAMAAMTVPKGTAVSLVFDQAVSSKTAHSGDKIMLHVGQDVMVNGKTIIKAGTKASAVVTEVHGRGRFGKNGQLKVSINPIMVNGAAVTLQPRQKGAMVGGTRGAQTAAVSGAGLIVLGPIGLGAGYFVVGKQVNVKVGDPLETEVSKDVRVR